MKRKIITKEQLDRLVSLGVVENNCLEYKYDGCSLFHGIMENELLGKTVNVEVNAAGDIGRFPFMTIEVLPWRIPAFILASNYKKMIAMAEAEGSDEEKAEESYILYRNKKCAVSRNAHSHHLHKDWRESGIDRHKAYTDGYLDGLKAGRNEHNCQEDRNDL